MIKTFLIFILFASCASTVDKQKEYCNSEGAYSKGYNDGKKDVELSSSALNFCKENQAALMKQYRTGYLKGQEIFAQSNKKQPTSALGSSPNLSLLRKCIMEFRGDTFLGEGYSYGEAIQNAQDKCVRVYGKQCPFVCETIKSN